MRQACPWTPKLWRLSHRKVTRTPLKFPVESNHRSLLQAMSVPVASACRPWLYAIARIFLLSWPWRRFQGLFMGYPAKAGLIKSCFTCSLPSTFFSLLPCNYKVHWWREGHPFFTPSQHHPFVSTFRQRNLWATESFLEASLPPISCQKPCGTGDQVQLLIVRRANKRQKRKALKEQQKQQQKRPKGFVLKKSFKQHHFLREGAD